jgi:hypothetical protein
MDHDIGQTIRSYLIGDNKWVDLAFALEDAPGIHNLGGVNIEAQDANGLEQPINRASLQLPAGAADLKITNGNIAWVESVPAQTNIPATIQIPGTTQLNPDV